MKLPVLNSYEKATVCGPCGGKCCQAAPGAAMPHDFGDTREEMLPLLIKRLASRRWAIDWWEGDPTDDCTEGIGRAYFVRPATSGVTDIFDPSWGGPCTFHGAHGCEIFSERPSGCRGLEPGLLPSPCVPRHSTKKDAAIAWLPFRDLILQAAGYEP